MQTPSAPRRRSLLTARDRSVLELLAEHRVLAEPHVQAHLRIGASAAARRLRQLSGTGLVRYERIFEGAPAAVWITQRGLDAVESRLPAPRLDLKGYRHDLGVGWLWLAARQSAFGPVAALTSERTMRSSDRLQGRTGQPFGIGLGTLGPRGGEQLHYPDLLIALADGRRVALELELSGKGRRRLDEIMLGYAADGRLDAVLYLVPAGPIGRAIEDAARRAGIADAVHVQLLARGSPVGAPDPGRRRAPLSRTSARALGGR